MKRALLIFSFLVLLPFKNFAQENYTVNGQEYSLRTEIEGPITLLWNIVDTEYRYFAQKDDTITELTNTKSDGDFQEKYKDTLQNMTTDNPVPTENVNLTLVSLRDFVVTYNLQVDPDFRYNKPSIKLGARLGVFAGITNSVFSPNPSNTILPTAGIDFELIDEVKLKRHSLVLRFKQTFSNDEYQYDASQFSLNYRLKFVKSETFDAFLNTNFASYTYSSIDNLPILQSDGSVRLESRSGGDFQGHAIFGLGADLKLGNGYLFLNYNDIFGLGVDSNDSFPVDFSLGYKFVL